MAGAVLHSVLVPSSAAISRSLEEARAPFGELQPPVAPIWPPVVRVSGAGDVLAAAAQRVPSGAAHAEAIAVLLRRSGVELSWGEPDVLPDAAAFVRLCYERGAASVAVARSEPSLLPELQLGTFFSAYWRRRLLRRVAASAPSPALLARLGRAGALAAEFAFWRGVRSTATRAEWDRYTRSSYVAFYYHRIGIGGWPGQEHLDVDRRRFERHLRLLRLLRFSPLTPEQLIGFHTNPNVRLPARSYIIAADDALAATVDTLHLHAYLHPYVFVNTSAAGGNAWWAREEAVAGWDELRALAADGGVVGSHCRNHHRLTQLSDEDLRAEIEGSLQDLGKHLADAQALLAYPHGLHDERVRAAAARAGYRAAFATAAGKNGVGTDPYSLRRIALTDWDGIAALLWKMLSGELLPSFWERSRRRFGRAKLGTRAAAGESAGMR